MTDEKTEQILVESPLEEYVGLINSTIIEWKSKQTPEHIKQEIIKSLEKKKNEVVLKLMGFDKDSFTGHYRVDHCNGRSGQSLAGDYLRNTAQKSVEAWLDSQVMPKLSKKEITAIAGDLQKEYVDVVKRRLREKVRQKAELDAQDLINKLCPTPDVSALLAAQKILFSD